MFRFILVCFCVTLVLASPSPKRASKIRNFKLQGPRIVNGELAQPGQFPWQAALSINDIFFSWFCGGTIISPEWILTAGHCVDGAWFGEVITGTTNLSGGESTDVAEFILHEGYDEELLANDIGLVRLSQPLKLDNNTAPVTLSSDTLGTNVSITVSGWGVTSDDTNTVSRNLNYVDLVTITKDQCEDEYGPGTIRNEMVCATSGSSQIKSTCNGDSGGPVIINADSDPVHVAVVSFVSDAGCESGAPSGYTRSAYYRDWIRQKTGI